MAKYSYKKISELQVRDNKVHVFGVVTLHRPPSKSHGTDFSCTVEIMDETCGGEPLTCVLFHPKIEQLPQQCVIGDIICLHRMNMKEYNGRLQGNCLRYGSSATFDGRPEATVEPRSGAGPHVFTEEEKQRVIQLKQWAAANHLSPTEPARVPSTPPTTPAGVSLSSGASTSWNTGRWSKKIGDLADGDKRVNIFGVVNYFKPPTPTKRGGYYSSLTVVDETSSLEGFNFVLFQQQEQTLPRVCSRGDILLVRGLYISKYEGSLQGKGYEHTSMAICFSGHPEARVEPRIGTASSSYVLTAEEERRVAQLRVWAATQEGLKPHERNCSLEDATVGQYFDFTCQVVATAVNLSERTCVLTVWDGTQLPLTCRKVDTSTYQIMQDPILTYRARNRCQKVVITGIMGLIKVQPGNIVRLINVCASPVTTEPVLVSGQPVVELLIQQGTQLGGGVILMAEEEMEVKELKKQLPSFEQSEPIWRKLKRPLPTSTTVVLRPEAKRPSTLENIRSFSRVPYKFVTKVKVVQVGPPSLKDFCQLRCPKCKHKVPTPKPNPEEEDLKAGDPCPHCRADDPDTSPALQFMYVFSLFVKDSTSGHAAMELYVTDTDAEQFLPKLPPANLYSDSRTKEALLDRLYYLTGGNDPFFDLPPDYAYPQPWMECGVLSYRSHTGRVCYRIFDTTLAEWDLA